MKERPRRGNPPPGWCTRTAAKRKLGYISDGRFQSLVDKEKITRWVPEGSSQGFYLIRDVNHIAIAEEDFTQKLAREELPGARFGMATVADMPEIVALLIEVFGGGDTSAKRIAWMEKNPEIVFIVRSKGEIVACVFLLPLTDQKITEIFAKATPGSTSLITPEDIQPYIPGKPVSIYILSMCAKAGNIKLPRRIRGSILVRGFFHYLTNLGSRGIPITTLAARTSEPEGVKLLRKLGFTEIETETLSRNFIIDIPLSGNPFVLPYKQAYKAERDRELKTKG